MSTLKRGSGGLEKRYTPTYGGLKASKRRETGGSGFLSFAEELGRAKWESISKASGKNGYRGEKKKKKKRKLRRQLSA